ncbi:DinB superfamily protein [Paenibacillus sp. UNCCL117]|uniref:DinB family protein n=1 Tax=unclassified Paenibacillus TaxID=185978 RepID=UPI00088394D7|nr:MULTISPECIES: DinB family protein [unclassified Paenibacillus]SDE10592.1 DinB superfamily protein [Paenibacillus sp. cl123]SFW59802.1 DinB superfamily protein [Paenibacillus sp. UNCCL117]
MDHFLFRQLDFVRSQTLKWMDGLTEEAADKIPEGFRNNIRWHFGHVYVVLERYCFQYSGLPLHLPPGFKERFEFGTSPLTLPASITAPVPTLEELRVLLQGQPGRIREALSHRMPEKAAQPYTTSAGMLLETPEQFVSFNLFHEGMHLSVIKLYTSLLRAPGAGH